MTATRKKCCWRGFARAGILVVVLFAILCFNWSVKENCGAKILLTIWETLPYENHCNFDSCKFSYNSLLSLFCPFRGWWCAKEKYIFFIYSESRSALLERPPEFNRLLQKNFLNCYSCSFLVSCCTSLSLLWFLGSMS